MSKAPLRSSRALRCAVYTRKSPKRDWSRRSTLHASARPARRSSGASATRAGLPAAAYDDGGRSGGNMERPALQAAAAEIREGKVDVWSSTRSTG